MKYAIFFFLGLVLTAGLRPWSRVRVWTMVELGDCLYLAKVPWGEGSTWALGFRSEAGLVIGVGLRLEVMGFFSALLWMKHVLGLCLKFPFADCEIRGMLVFKL